MYMYSTLERIERKPLHQPIQNITHTCQYVLPRKQYTSMSQYLVCCTHTCQYVLPMQEKAVYTCTCIPLCSMSVCCTHTCQYVLPMQEKAVYTCTCISTMFHVCMLYTYMYKEARNNSKLITGATIPEVAWGDEGLERAERPGRVGTGMDELRFKSSNEGSVFPAYREGVVYIVTRGIYFDEDLHRQKRE